jgi:hypothetical protein
MRHSFFRVDQLYDSACSHIQNSETIGRREDQATSIAGCRAADQLWHRPKSSLPLRRIESKYGWPKSINPVEHTL